MGEIRPLGSEKLSTDEKLKRILELTYFQSPINESKKSKFELIVEGKNTVYGIQKEKDGYYVKKGINENTLDYIGGIFMKNKNRFTSYADALKRLEYIKGQEDLNEATKYILKNKSSNNLPTNEQQPTATPIPEPPVASDNTLPPSPANTSEEPPIEEPTDDNLNADVEDENDPLKAIQKLSGKLGQKLREFDEQIESDDIKYVLNMVISAIDLNKLEDTDKDEIIGKFEGEETPENDEDYSDVEPVADVTPEDELGETFSSLEELTNTDLDFDYDDDDEFEKSFRNEFNNENDIDDEIELDEYNMFDDEDYSEDNENFYDIEDDDISLDNNFYDNDSDFEFNDLELDEYDMFDDDDNYDESLFNDTPEEIEEYGTSSLRSRRRPRFDASEFNDYDLSINEIKKLIKKNIKR